MGAERQGERCVSIVLDEQPLGRAPAASDGERGERRRGWEVVKKVFEVRRGVEVVVEVESASLLAHAHGGCDELGMQDANDTAERRHGDQVAQHRVEGSIGEIHQLRDEICSP